MNNLLSFTFLARVIAGLTLALSVSCSDGGQSRLECIDNADCTSEGTFACIDDSCVAVDCLSSDSCALREYCDDESWSCTPGCAVDEDCAAGELCDNTSNTCEAYGCRDTQLDCEFGQVCNTATGACQDAPGEHCTRCDWWTTFGVCTSTADCIPFDEFAEDSFCMESCNPNAADACPRGFECIDIYGLGSDYYCFAWCPLVEEMGW